MTTYSFVSSWSYVDDAAFRAWGSSFSNALLTVGLTKTADTGQIDWLTVTKPLANNTAGYEIWRFNDALQSTMPIYMKFWFNSGTNIIYPTMNVQFGTGSDGAGNLTGPSAVFGSDDVYSSPNRVFTGTTPGALTYPSYFCYNTTYGTFSFIWKYGSTSGGEMHGFMSVARMSNVDGTPNDAGVNVIFFQGPQVTSPSGLTFTATDYRANYDIYTSSGVGFVTIPSTAASSPNPSQPQAFVGFASCPAVYPVVAWCGYHDTEVTILSSFQATLLGSTPITYLALSDGAGQIADEMGYNVDYGGFAILYE
jgi:hypothetical protein